MSVKLIHVKVKDEYMVMNNEKLNGVQLHNLLHMINYTPINNLYRMWCRRELGIIIYGTHYLALSSSSSKDSAQAQNVSMYERVFLLLYISTTCFVYNIKQTIY